MRRDLAGAENMDRYKKIMTGMLTGLLLCCAMHPEMLRAEPVLAGSYVYGAGQGAGPGLLWYVRGLGTVPGSGSAEGILAGFGEAEGIVEEWGKLSDREGMYRTVILFDNSLSMILSDPANGDRAKALADAFIDAHAPGEWFSVYTFDRELHLLGEGTDYDTLKELISNTAFVNQDSFLLKALETVLKEQPVQPDEQPVQPGETEYPAFTRVLLITDGADDNPAPPSFSDIGKLIRERNTLCPVYTGICVWEKEQKGIRELLSLSEASGGRAFMLNEYNLEETAGIAFEAASEDQNMYYFFIRVPEEALDGEAKEAGLTVTDTEGQVFSAVRDLPGALFQPAENSTPKVQEGAETEAVYTAQEQTEEVTEDIMQEAETDRAETEMTETPLAETDRPEKAALERSRGGPEDETKPVYYIFAAAVIALSLGLFGFVFLRFFRPGSGNRTDDPTGRTKGNGLTDVRAGREATVSMWDRDGRPAGGMMVILRDMTDPQEQYVFYVQGEISVGRGSSCDVVIETDRSVSKRHLTLAAREGVLFAEDCESTNGTFINDLRISVPRQLRDGDILGIGNKRMKVDLKQG